ncbi:hypothetical protein BHF68_13665 [Desulfuribacillus alkaliarsenatis]|uniref:Uncharacterized protein n=1 Tax=Desulfuribacillus alkaliarsenatis TaxID=766136 RepID=A0A1E5G4C9_9FIRM|nr:hypothetical protein BHF68_13665 [Desulfuribacillus alkaliarsenatis]
MSNNNQSNTYTDKNSNKKSNQCNNGNKKRKNKLTPAQLLVIIGILAGSLQVDSIAIDKDQTIQILLAGSLKRKTQLDEMLDEMGEMPFEQVFKAMMNRLG